MKISYDEYKEMHSRIMHFKEINKRYPKKVILKGIDVQQAQYEDMINRVNNFIRDKGRAPKAVEVKGFTVPKPTPSKPNKINELQAAVGGNFTNLTQLYQLIKNNVYAHYNNDRYTFKSELKRLNQHAGLNCADFAQVGMLAIEGLNQMGLNYKARYVHVKCRDKRGRPNPKAGHFFLQVIGGEFKNWTNYDLSEAASGKKPIGSTMCTYGYAVQSYNDYQLLVDDGR